MDLSAMSEIYTPQRGGGMGGRRLRLGLSPEDRRALWLITELNRQDEAFREREYQRLSEERNDGE